MKLFQIFKPKNKPDDSKRNASNLEKLVSIWLNSETRKQQLQAKRYYEGQHDILLRQRMVIDAQGKMSPVENLPNNRIIDNQYKKLVDQKTSYALGKPITLATADDSYLEQLNKIFSRKVNRQIKLIAQQAINCGLCWVYPHYNEQGNLAFAVFPAYEILPIWKDKAHDNLAFAIRYYQQDVFDDKGAVVPLNHVDVFRKQGIEHYEYRGGHLTPLGPNAHQDYVYVGQEGFNWSKLPLIPFKYNAEQIPLIRGVKTLQDALNLCLSNFQNNMEEDPRNSILVLKNYDGTNAAQFRQNLATYGLIKVTTVDGVQGGVQMLHIDVNAQNYQANLMQLKRAIVQNGRGFDAKEQRMDGDPNQMNIESMYTDIDLDVNAMEAEFQAGFDQLLWFINQYIKQKTGVDYSDKDVQFVFNRDIFINEDAKIENCVKSVGVISNKTIVARHPWVTNLQHELSQIQEDEQKQLDSMEATLEVQHKHEDHQNDQGNQ